MGWIDVMIPGVIGLVAVLVPGALSKAEGQEGEAARTKIRRCGLVLLGVALVYAFIAAVGTPG